MVLVAGVAGASLGTEAVKALLAGGRYRVAAADISPLAFGLHMEGPCARVLLREDRYVEDLIDACRRIGVSAVVPAADATGRLVSDARQRLEALGIACGTNHPDVVALCSDKAETFARLDALGVPIPRTVRLSEPADLPLAPFPCVIKPSTGSGGSIMVAVATSPGEALVHASAIWSTGRAAVAQEYLAESEGEFTVGVLSLGRWTGSIAMRREFPSKLSYLVRSRGFVVSSGYSQGVIDDFPAVRRQAERIAGMLGSEGPMNVQGRMRGGEFIPFEINARFSATTYLRHLAGFPELQLLVDHLLTGRVPDCAPAIRRGHFLRSLSEVFVPLDGCPARP